jgi:CHAD domain-containing protein
MAALKLFSGLLPKKEVRWFRKTLRRIRRAAGNARDMDVLAQNHEQDVGKGARAFLAEVRQRREAAQRPIVAIHRNMKRDNRLLRHIDNLLEKAGTQTSNAADGSFSQWARSRLQKRLERFFKASSSDVGDLTSLHRFRIRGKELRYAMELLAPAFPRELREELYPVVEQLQGRLGEIHDHTVAGVRLVKWVALTKSKKKAVHMRKLLEQEREQLAELLPEFASWWTPEFQARLEDSVKQLIERPPPALSFSDR